MRLKVRGEWAFPLNMAESKSNLHCSD
uniref:Uncharacterized protein n=1 Tax=Anguilla anguilla TaxID=7936 RepID=A0A0E9UBF9_ANGAN